jgi:hypothetical protein
VRWDDEDAITHDPLRKRDDVAVLDDVISGDVRLYSGKNSRRAGRIYMKFVMEVTPFEANSEFYFLISCY